MDASSKWYICTECVRLLADPVFKGAKVYSTSYKGPQHATPTSTRAKRRRA